MPGLGMQQTWSPRVLFPATGAGGCWYDPSDLSTMFQDTAGTTPCAVGSRVALLKDKGPFGYDVSQATTANQPYLRQESTTNRYYLEFGGVGVQLVSAASVPLSTTTMFAVIAKQSISYTGTYPTTFYYRDTDYNDEARLPMFGYSNGGLVLIQYGSSGDSSFSGTPTNKIVVSAGKQSGTFTSYQNGVQKVQDTSIANPSSSALKRVYVGFDANFKFYGALVIYGFNNIAADRNRIEKWMSDRMALVY